MKTRLTFIMMAIFMAASATAQTEIRTTGKAYEVRKQSFSSKITSISNTKNFRYSNTASEPIMDIEFQIVHAADTMFTYTWDEFSASFELEKREVFTYENDKVVLVVKEQPMNDGFFQSLRNHYSYHPNGLLAEESIDFFDPEKSMWIPQIRRKYEYDQQGNIIMEEEASWHEVEWIPHFRFRVEYVLNENNKKETVTAEFWSLYLDQENWFPSYREQYLYDDMGRVESMIFCSGGFEEFVTEAREDYFYEGDATEYTEVIIYEKFDDEWIATYKISEMQWYNFEKELIESATVYDNENWDDWDDWKSDFEEDEWFPMFRWTLEYHPALDEVILFNEEVFFGDTWFPLFRVVSKYNEHHFLVNKELQYHFDGWETDMGIAVHGYFCEDGHPLDLRLMQFDAWESDEWQNYQWLLFEYTKEEEDATSVSPVKPADLARVFPNPVNDRLFIAPEEFSGEIQVRIFNIAGQQIAEKMVNVSSGQTSLEMSHLPSGVYMVSITAKEKQQTVKIVKR